LHAIIVASALAVLLLVIFAAWRRYLWAAQKPVEADSSPYSLTDIAGDRPYLNVPHQQGIQWLHEIFSRSAKKFPRHTALQIPHTGETLTYAELDARAEKIADALAPYITGPDQVVAVAMSQDNWQIVACHLGILKAGGTLMFLDTALPEALITHMLNDAKPVVILTRGAAKFRDQPTLDVLSLPEKLPRRKPPTWLDDPAQRLATIFYTSGTTGMPKGVECPHAGYINLALSYADYFGLIPGYDATTLTSSLGYDGSISELYSAWVSGCAVVMLTQDEVRSGPDLVPILRAAEVTVLFCPPVLLTTLTATPELDLPYPLCRYIVPAGEAFPAALVEPWTRARRQIINTYGPTEASTDTSRQSLRPGEPITIGSPFANVTYAILEVDQLGPLPHGEIGELCIGGVHVARGYRNLPDQTAEKFIAHPEFGRLYRTGDKCRIDPRTKQVHFLGRIDAQMKVRGHRVEAQAVEDILQTQFGEIEAAVLDYQNEALVAFVSAPSVGMGPISSVALAPADWSARVTETLARQLPAPSVPTSIFLVDKFVMKPVSGKIDRKSLPDLSLLLQNGESLTPDHDHNGTETVKTIIEETEADGVVDADCAEVLAICRAVFETPLGLDDGFAESGGHSIVIARLAQKLQAAGRRVSVRALLSDRNTARKVAGVARETAPDVRATRIDPDECAKYPARDEAAAELLTPRYFTALQVLFTILIYSPLIAILIGFFEFADVETIVTSAGFRDFLVDGLYLYLAILVFPFVTLLWVMLIKYLMGGRFRTNQITPGLYPKWSKMHLRIWCVGRLENLVLVPLGAMYRSAPLLAFVLRQLGAQVGRNLQCAHDASLSGPLDLVSIEDDVAIQTGAYLQTARWSGQFLQVGPIQLERGCKIGMRAAIANNVTVGAGSWITPFTPILNDVGPQELWEGAPARAAGRCVELKRTAKVCTYTLPIWLLETFNVVMQIVHFFALNLVPIAVLSWLAVRYMTGGDLDLSAPYFRVTPMPTIVWHLILFGFVTTWVSIVAMSLLDCIFIRLTAARPGMYPSRGFRGALLLYRLNLMNAIQRQWTWTMTGQYLRALAGVRFPRFGASECDQMYNVVPELTSADSQVFWSNGSYTNMLDYGAEHIQLRRLDMPRNFFSGNNCVAEYGQFPANFLLGVSTPGSEIEFRRQMRSRMGEPITVAGNPPVKFASASFEDENEIHQLPGFALFLARILLNDIFGIGIIRITELLVFAILYVEFTRQGFRPIVAAGAGLILTVVATVLLGVVTNKLLVGSRWGVDHSAPFWSLRHFAYFFAQDCFFAWCRIPLGLLAGTILANPLLRWMGCRIGRRTIVTQPMQCFDWNAVDLGDDCVVDGYLQLHTFENMELKVKRSQIQAGCTVAFGATVMGGAEIERDTTLLPLSLVLKAMNLLTGTYEGSPVEVASEQSLPARMYGTVRAKLASHLVDNTDWLKTAAIILVSIDHFGYFFAENDLWWGAFGRLAAPTFFFLVGYARSRKVPIHWIVLGVILTLLDISNNDWSWMPPNILLSFALIRLAGPQVQKALLRYPWATFVLVVGALIAVLPFAAQAVDYGAEGWLWALLGLCQRNYVDARSTSRADGLTQEGSPPTHSFKHAGLLRALVCVATAVVYVWQEQKEFGFGRAQLTVVVVGIALLSLCLCLFARGLSRIQPPVFIADMMSFMGRHTLEIYAIQLAGSEILVKFVRDLLP
jgi:non-ribosomal peptide synthetase-like protein